MSGQVQGCFGTPVLLISYGMEPPVSGWMVFDGSTLNLEAMRELRALLYRRPWGTEQRVLILNAERVGASSWSVLLKTMEELPPDTRLLIQAENLSGMPDTVVSRCTVYYVPQRIEQRTLSFGGSKVIRAIEVGDSRMVLEATKDLDSLETLQELVEWLSGWASVDLMQKAYTLLDLVQRGGRAVYAVVVLALRAIPAYRYYKETQ